MNWEALGAIGEIIGAMAVVATLAYLIIQIRQNTRGIHSAAVQANTLAFNEITRMLASNPHLAEIFDRGSDDPDALNEEEKHSFLWLVSSVMNLYQNLFDQYRQGTLPENVWQKHSAEIKFMGTQPGFKLFRELDSYFEDLWRHVDALPAADHSFSLELER